MLLHCTQTTTHTLLLGALPQPAHSISPTFFFIQLARLILERNNFQFQNNNHVLLKHQWEQERDLINNSFLQLSRTGLSSHHIAGKLTTFLQHPTVYKSTPPSDMQGLDFNLKTENGQLTNDVNIKNQLIKPTNSLQYLHFISYYPAKSKSACHIYSQVIITKQICLTGELHNIYNNISE